MKNSKPKLEIGAYGTNEWRLNGKLHREDGPTIIYSSETKEWRLKGKEYTYDEWFNKLTPEQQINYLWNLDNIK